MTKILNFLKNLIKKVSVFSEWFIFFRQTCIKENLKNIWYESDES